MCLAHCLVGISLLLAPAARTASPGTGPPVQITAIGFDPIGPGKNRLNFSMHNTGTAEQRIGVRVTARSADGRNTWKGWIEYGLGAPRYDGGYVGTKAVLDPNEARDGHYLFQIPEPFGERAAITVEFYDLLDPKQKTAAALRREPKPYLTKPFVAGKLPQRPIDWRSMAPAPPDQANAARAAFAEAQLRLRLGLYTRASQLFSKALRDVELAPIPMFFRKRLYPTAPSWHTWDGRGLVQLTPGDVRVTERGLVLLSADKDRLRPVEMIEENGEWKIDWVHPPIGARATTAPATRPSK